MDRYKIEYDRFQQMYDDVEIAISNLRNGDNHTDLRYLNDCMIMMKTENDFYGKPMPIDLFQESQQRVTAITT